MVYMQTSAVGVSGEMLVTLDLLSKDCGVFKDVVGANAVDLLVRFHDKYLKVQVKTVESSQDGVANLSLSKKRRMKDGSFKREAYVNRGIDVMALAVLDRRQVLYVDCRQFKEEQSSISVRFTPPRNSQIKKITYASDLTFEKVFGK